MKLLKTLSAVLLFTVSAYAQTGGAVKVWNGTNIASVSASNALKTDAVQSGTWTVQPGNTANTTPWLTTNTVGILGGWTAYHLVSAGTTNATVVKASAGQLGGWYIYNNNAAMRKLCLHNTASAPTAGAGIYFCLNLPSGPTAANVLSGTGIDFSAGIAFTTVTDLADSGTTAVGANDLSINLFYK